MRLPLLASLLGTLLPLWSHTTTAEPTPPPSPSPRNVILLIGDGTDDNWLTIARHYLHGQQGELVMDRLPIRSTALVQTVEEDAPHRPLYVADSANSATSIATGIVTSPGRIGTHAGSDADATSLSELAAQAGVAVGLVTTASITDATPASFAAHVSQRRCESPERTARVCPQDRLAAGGPGSISEQLALGPVQLLIGGGLKHFQQPSETDPQRTVLELAEQRGFQVATDAQQLSQIAKQGRLLALLAPSTLPVAWTGVPEAEAVRVTPQNYRQLTVNRCQPDPTFQLPRLAALTELALQRLENPNGFFLMVESASVDKQSHARRPCGAIGELAQLDEATAVALAYADRHPQTLVIVTADHGQAAQLISYPSMMESWLPDHPEQLAPPGHLSLIETPEGGVLAVSFATNLAPAAEHTGITVPVLMNRAGQVEPGALMRQRELFEQIRDYLNW